MKTKRQEELVSAFLVEAGEKDGPVYRELIGWLEGLGYFPQKERANLSFKHDRGRMCFGCFRWCLPHSAGGNERVLGWRSSNDAERRGG